MPLITTSDPDDPRLALYRGVSDPVLLRDHGVFLAEGRLVVRRLLTESRHRAVSVLVTPPARADIADVLSDRPDLPVYVASQAVLNAIAGFNVHRGCLALGARPSPSPWLDVLDAVPGVSRIVALEAVSNADNIGGIFRSAHALGVDAVLLGPGCSDPLYRKAIRTSIGSTLVVPFASVAPWPDFARTLRGRGFLVLALTPSDGALTIGAVAREHGRRDRLAIVAGAEGHGLTPEALAASDVRVRIPMAEGVDSLNVGVALAIALQRLGEGGGS